MESHVLVEICLPDVVTDGSKEIHKSLKEADLAGTESDTTNRNARDRQVVVLRRTLPLLPLLQAALVHSVQ